MDKNLDNVVVSIRLRGADAARYWRVMDEAKARNPYIDKSDVIRELLGLDPPRCLTDVEIAHFRDPVKQASLKPSQMQMAPERNGNKEGKKIKAA